MKTSFLLSLASSVFFFGVSAAGYSQNRDTLLVHFTVIQCDSLIQANATNSNFVVMDVRTPGEYTPEHLEGAINRNYYAPNFYNLLDLLPRHKMYVLYCLGGSRSGSTFNLMSSMGFTKVVNMLGGISAWKNAGLPTTSAFAPLQMAVSDTIVPDDTVYIGTTDTIRLTVTNRANDTLRFTGITSLAGTEFSTDFDTAMTLEGPFDYTFSIFYAPADESTDSVDFLIGSNGGPVMFHITRTGKIMLGGPAQFTNYGLRITNYPNPFEDITVIEFHNPASQIVTLEVNDFTGKKIRTVLSAKLPEGNHQVLFKAADLKTGIYFCRIHAGNQVVTGKLVKY